MARSVDIWSCFVDLGMDCKCSSIDRFITYDYLAFLVDQDEVRHAYLREMFGQRIEPWNQSATVIRYPNFRLTEMVSQDRVTDADVSCNALIEASFGEHSVGCSEMLLSIQSFFFPGVEFGIRSDFQSFASLIFSKGPDRGIAIALTTQSGRNRSHK